MKGPQTAIDNWRQWGLGLRARPRVVRPLPGGRSNRNYLLETDGRSLVLRLNAGGALLPGGTREAENEAWRSASDARIAPPLLFADTANGVLLSEYIDGELPARPQDDPVLGGRALDLLQRCHRMETRLPAIDYRAHVKTYWRMILGAGIPAAHLARQRRDMQRVLETLLASDLGWGPCHHDPVVANFVGSRERLYLVDWEYAAHGLQLMDYAALSVEWGFDAGATATAAGTDARLLAMAMRFYRYLCELWETLGGQARVSS
ncbi:MAG: choline/ethanolamine kinase family protein [Lysobacterales bacterium]|jgi:thiamine kinase